MHATDESDGSSLRSIDAGCATTNANYMLYQDALATPELPTKIIKHCMCVIIQRTMNQLMQEYCYGCRGNKPCKHVCLYELPSGFYEENLEELKKRIYRPRLLRALMRVCEARGYRPTPLKIMGAVDMIIWGLSQHPESEEEFEHVYSCISDELLALIEAAIESWLGLTRKLLSRPT